jgi:acetyl esterase/lipase
MSNTHIYKTVGGVEIAADVYPADSAQPRPAVVWIHGGALVMGSRRSVPTRLLDLCRVEGFVLVSMDYRLAPQVKLPAIVEDVQDGLRWVRQQKNVDPNRLVVTGGSAGGYLTMMTGICVTPPPTALVAYWGYGDVDGDWYAQPSDFYRRHVPLISPEEAYAGLNDAVLTGTDGNTEQQTARGRYYHYLRQNGLWTKEVTGFDPASERRKLDSYCPVRNVTPQYPPLLMVHGTDDTDVPYEKSADMARELARHNLPHALVTVPNAGHGLSGGDPTLIDEAHAQAVAFIRKHLCERS